VSEYTEPIVIGRLCAETKNKPKNNMRHGTRKAIAAVVELPLEVLEGARRRDDILLGARDAVEDMGSNDRRSIPPDKNDQSCPNFESEI
jgi:hypothetical protein